MARLPIEGSDAETWGGLLNAFLSVALNGDGTLKSSGGGSSSSSGVVHYDESTTDDSWQTTDLTTAHSGTGGANFNTTFVMPSTGVCYITFTAELIAAPEAGVKMTYSISGPTSQAAGADGTSVVANSGLYERGSVTRRFTGTPGGSYTLQALGYGMSNTTTASPGHHTTFRSFLVLG